MDTTHHPHCPVPPPSTHSPHISPLHHHHHTMASTSVPHPPTTATAAPLMTSIDMEPTPALTALDIDSMQCRISSSSSNSSNSNNIDGFHSYSFPPKSQPPQQQQQQQQEELQLHLFQEQQEIVRSSASTQEMWWRLLYVPLFAMVNLSIVALFFFPLKRQLGLGTMWSLEDLRRQMSLLSDEQVWSEHGASILGLYMSMYIFNQTFCVPGSIIMNLFAHIFGTVKGVMLVAFLTATGASSAFMMSKIVGKQFLLEWKWFSSKLGGFQKMVQGTSKLQLFVILTALRIFPFTPNFFVNIASPILDVPLWLFYPSVLLGLLPFHISTVSAGQFIHELQSTQDLYQPKTVIFMVLLSILVVAPILLQRTSAVKKLFKLE